MTRRNRSPQPRTVISSARALHGFTLVELLVVITVIGILLGLLLPAVQSAREAARRAQCSNNLRQLGLAIQMYHDATGRFPPGANLHDLQGKESIGWRVLILPYLEETNLYDQIQPTPDGGSFNQEPRLWFVNVLICPSAERQDDNPALVKVSNYFGVAGPGRDGKRKDLLDIICGDMSIDGMFYARSRTTMAKIIDGTSRTLAIGERIYNFQDHWMLGGRWFGDPFSENSQTSEIYMAAAKNVTWPFNARRYFVGDITAPPGADKDVLFNDLYFGSDHPGIAQFCLGDGSVRGLSETIDLIVFGDLATIDGGETTSVP